MEIKIKPNTREAQALASGTWEKCIVKNGAVLTTKPHRIGGKNYSPTINPKYSCGMRQSDYVTTCSGKAVKAWYLRFVDNIIGCMNQTSLQLCKNCNKKVGGSK